MLVIPSAARENIICPYFGQWSLCLLLWKTPALSILMVLVALRLAEENRNAF